MSKTAGIILQARMGSTRLPGKSMMRLGDTNLVGYIIRRLNKCLPSLSVVLATSKAEKDNALASWAETMGYRVCRGDEQNVLHRYVECATQFNFDPVIRLTGDNPFVDLPEMLRLLLMFQEQKCEYISSHGQLPLGSGAEIFSLSAMSDSLKHAYSPDHFEHVNEYILQHPEKFKVGRYLAVAEKNFPAVRLTVDTQQDLEQAQQLVDSDTDPAGSVLPILNTCLHSA